jgi:hypothetical protein
MGAGSQYPELVQPGAREARVDSPKSVSFTVSRPISINRMYGRGRMVRGQRGLYLTPEGKAFKGRIILAALEARQRSEWPRNLWRIRKAELSFQLYDFRGDTDGPRKATKDALEGILYVNDRLVQDGPAPLPIRDGKGARMVVTVEILELIDDDEARVLEERLIRLRARK